MRRIVHKFKFSNNYIIHIKIKNQFMITNYHDFEFIIYLCCINEVLKLKNLYYFYFILTNDYIDFLQEYIILYSYGIVIFD